MTTRFTVRSVPGIGEIVPGDDLAMIIGDAIASTVDEGVVVVVTSKIVSKAEGRIVSAEDRADAIARETVRVVAEKHWFGGSTRIVENRLGLVQAAAGVDASNTPEGTVLLLPEDPDRSAFDLCGAFRNRFGLHVGVIITDTMGRPWRLGQTDVAIGAAGVLVLDDLSGATDDFGRPLHVTSAAIADEIAGAANLVAGKTSRCPVTLVHGLGGYVLDDLERARANSTARELIRDAADDLFRIGAREAYEEGRRAGIDEARRAQPRPARRDGRI